MASPTKNRKIEEIEYLRGYAILAVIIIHSMMFTINMKSVSPLMLLNMSLDVFVHFAVPLFILISGTVLALNYGTKFSLKKFYHRRVFSVVPQYLICSIAITIYQMYVLKRQMPLESILFNLLTANSNFHLWFFALLLQLYLLYPFLISIADKASEKKQDLSLILAAFFIQTLWNMFYAYLTGLSYTNPDLALTADLAKKFFLTNIFYFIAGIYIGKHIDKTESKASNQRYTPYVISILAVTAFLTYVDITNLFDHSQPFYILLLNSIEQLVEPVLFLSTIVILYKTSLRISGMKNILVRTLRNFGDYSFGIYLIHPLYLPLITKILENMGITFLDWLFYPIVFITLASMSYLTVYAISLLPHGYLIVGVNTTTLNKKNSQKRFQDLLKKIGYSINKS